jgi:LPS sulfotransferase NodH
VTTRFVLLCHQRSGSTLLNLALRQHPRLFVHGEMLSDNEEQKRRWFNVGGRWFQGPDDDAVAFVRDHVLVGRAGDRDLGVGFKLMHYHANSGRAAAVWDYLAAETEIRIVHLRRHDLLATCVSDLTAQRSGQWSVQVNTDERPQAVPRFAVDAGECRRYFEQLEAAIAAGRARFAAHPYLELRYEDLVADFQGELARVWRFLDVAPHASKQRLVKQALLPPSQQLSNFDELRASFCGTRWEPFFRE